MFKAILMKVDDDGEIPLVNEYSMANNFDLSPVEKRTVTPAKTIVRHDQQVSVANKALVRLARDFAEFDEYPSIKQLVVDWKMPEDCQRIMVFEKLCYYLKAFECK